MQLSAGRVSTPDPGKDRVLESDAEERHPTRQQLLPGDLERQIAAFVEHYNHVRYHKSIDNPARRRLLWQSRDNPS
jgi:hypothetical protein